jgi:hypothetical protein
VEFQRKATAADWDFGLIPRRQKVHQRMNNIRRKEKDDSDTDDYSGDYTRPGHLKSDSLRGGNFSGRAAFAYRNDDTGK